MLKISAATLAIGWALLLRMHLTGNLVWDNGLLWVAEFAFGTACLLALFVAAQRDDQRAAAVAIAIGSVASCLVLAVLWFYLFALVGK